MIHKAYMPVYKWSRFLLRTDGTGPTEGSTRGPRRRKKTHTLINAEWIFSQYCSADQEDQYMQCKQCRDCYQFLNFIKICPLYHDKRQSFTPFDLLFFPRLFNWCYFWSLFSKFYKATKYKRSSRSAFFNQQRIAITTQRLPQVPCLMVAHCLAGARS